MDIEITENVLKTDGSRTWMNYNLKYYVYFKFAAF